MLPNTKQSYVNSVEVQKKRFKTFSLLAPDFSLLVASNLFYIFGFRKRYVQTFLTQHF